MPYETPDNIPHDSYSFIKLHDYQKYAHDFLITRPYAALFLEPGLGKTLITLSVLYDLNPNGNVLIIAPKNIARSTWISEIEKWGFPLRTCSLIVDEKDRQLSRAARLKLYAEAQTSKPTVYFINQELISDLIKHLPSWCFPYVVIDESQGFKSYKALRFQDLKTVRPFIQRLIELTGTPATNGLQDLWSQIYLLDLGQRLGTSITRYREAFFTPELIVNNHPVKWSLNPGADTEIHKRISDIAISMENKNLALPPVYNNIYVHMEPKERKLYDKMKKEYVLSLLADGDSSDGTAVEAVNAKSDDEIVDIIAANAAVLSAKLRQMASGALYVNPDGDYEVIHKRKLEHTAYLLRNVSSPVLIAYHFHSDREQITEYLEQNGFDFKIFDGSPKMLNDWNNQQIPILLIQPASAGRGLNFQQGGHTLIWYTIPWSLEDYIQTNARLHRQGQSHTVVIHHLITKDTIDEKVLLALDRKSMTQNDLIQAVKAQF